MGFSLFLNVDETGVHVMDREKFVKNVYSHLVSMLLASFIFMVVIQWFTVEAGGEAVSWLTSYKRR